jgi:uncharacterized membrane protein
MYFAVGRKATYDFIHVGRDILRPYRLRGRLSTTKGACELVISIVNMNFTSLLVWTQEVSENDSYRSI